MSQPVAEYEVYKRIKVLGEGSFGKAYLVECVSDHSLCVIKQVDLSKMNDQEKRDTLNEAKILEAFNHPNIVKFKEVYKTKKGKLCIVMDYADGGDLSNKIKEQKNTYFNENIILDWFTQITLAIKHVHDRKVLHRDLKCQNIFLTKSNLIKLGDFGIARVLSSTRENAKTMVGTPYYLSPEIINGRPYSFKSDIWSLGVVLYEICCLKPPFDASSLTFLAMKIVKGQYNPIPNMYSKELRNLISTLLQVDPNKRPLTNSILQMPIIQARVKNFLSETVRVQELSHTVLHNEKFVKSNLKFENIRNVNNEGMVTESPKPQISNPQPKPQQAPVQKPIYNPNPIVNKPSEPVQRPQTRQNNEQPRPNYIEKPKEDPKAQNDYLVRQSPVQNIPRYNPSPFLKPEKREDEYKKEIISHADKNYSPINPAFEAKKNMINPQPQPQQNYNIYKKPVEKEAIIGGGFGGGMVNVANYVPIKKQEPKPVPKKAIQNQQVKDKKDDLEYQKLLEKKKKAYEAEKVKREKMIAEEKLQKQISEDKRAEKRKILEDRQMKMREDIAAKRRAAQSKQKELNFEVVGARDYSDNQEIKSPGLDNLDDTPQFPEESRISPDKIEETLVEPTVLVKKDSRQPSKIVEDRPGKSDIKKFIQQKQNEAKQNRKLYTPEEDLDKGGVKFEIYVPTKEPPKRVIQSTPIESPKLCPPHEKPELDQDNNVIEDYADYGEDVNTEEEKYDPDQVDLGEDKEDFDEDEQDIAQDDIDFENENIDENKITPNIEKILSKIGNEEEIDVKENEDLHDYNALVLELSNLMEHKTEPNEADQQIPIQETKASSNEEDRIDDPDDDMTTVKSMTFNGDNDDDNMKTDVTIDYISDFGKLESLRISLEDGLGMDNFIKAYRIIKELYEKNQDLNEVEDKYAKTDYYMKIFPFLTRELIEQFLPQMFLFCLMEDIAEQDK